MKNLIAFDFSIAKPAAVIFSNNTYLFYSWPKDMSVKNKNLFLSSDINIMNRKPLIQCNDVLKYDLINARLLSEQIISDLQDFINDETIVAFEGLSYASKGNQTLSLAGWRYIFISMLSNSMPLDHMFTYSPITVKSVAGCAKRGMGKPDMIQAFIDHGPHCGFHHELKEDPLSFKKKGGKTWIEHLDDLVDSYWVLETLRVKEFGLK